MNLDRGPAWVYRMFAADGRLLYVGSTTNLPMRLRGHMDKPWIWRVAKVKATVHPTVRVAREIEREAIGTEKPLHNVYGRTDLSNRHGWTVHDYDEYIAAHAYVADSEHAAGRRLQRIEAERIYRFGDPA